MFYANSSKYKRMGVTVGRFYNQQGQPTEDLTAFEACLTNAKRVVAEVRQLTDAAPKCVRARFPERRPGMAGYMLTCTSPLVPHRTELPDTGERCSCLEPAPPLEKDDGITPKLYKGCAPDESVCAPTR